MTAITVTNGQVVMRGDKVGTEEECCCDNTGLCCEQFCIQCVSCDYQWDGTQYALIGQFIYGPCPTTECPECPATAGTDYTFDYRGLAFCCPYPDSYYICYDGITEAQCGGFSWVRGGTCAETEEEVQSACEELLNEIV